MKKIFAALFALYSAFAFSTTTVPVQLLNPIGSTNGQVITSGGPSSAPAWSSPSARTCPSIMDYGGNNTNSASNNAAFASAAAAAPSGQACVYFPPGTFQFASQLIYTLPTTGASISVVGAGADVTNLTWPNAAGGVLINYSSPGNSSHFRDFTISTGIAGGGNGINLTQTSCLNQFAQTDIQRVTFRGFDNNAGAGGLKYWSDAYLVNGVSGTSVDTVTVYGSGAGASALGNGGVYQGNGTCYSIYHNITKSTFNDLSIGMEYLSYAQGLTLTQSNFQNTNTGFLTPASQLGVLSQLQISDSQFATTGNAISLLTNIGNVMIHDNDLFCHVGNSCILFGNAAPQGFTITGNSINSDGSGAATGISIGSPFAAGQSGTITGNEIGGLSVGVSLVAGSSGNYLLNNAYTGNTTNVTNSGTGNFVELSVPPAIGNTTPNSGAFTTLSASSTVSGAGFSTYLASPPAIGGTSAAAGAFTTLNASGNDALLYSNISAQSIPNAAYTTVTGWTKTFDRVNANFNASTGVFTAPATGYYQVSAQLVFGANTGAVGTAYGAAISANSVQVAIGLQSRDAAGSAQNAIEVSAVVSLTAGQTIVLQAFQNTGAALALSSTAAQNYLNINRLP